MKQLWHNWDQLGENWKKILTLKVRWRRTRERIRSKKKEWGSKILENFEDVERTIWGRQEVEDEVEVEGSVSGSHVWA